MTILDAEKTVMPWGVHVGKTLGEIAALDVTYLDFLLGVEVGDFVLATAVLTVAEKHSRSAKRGSRPFGDARQFQLF